MHSVELPWPPSELMPNRLNGVHWAKFRKIKNEYRDACHWICKGLSVEKSERVSLTIIFHPPDRRVRDIDGLLSALKHGLDGMALAIGIDDSKFRPLLIDDGEIIKGGLVRVTIATK